MTKTANEIEKEKENSKIMESALKVVSGGAAAAAAEVVVPQSFPAPASLVHGAHQSFAAPASLVHGAHHNFPAPSSLVHGAITIFRHPVRSSTASTIKLPALSGANGAH